MEFFNMVMSIPPIFDIFYKVIAGGVLIILSYTVGHYVMRGLGALWRRI